MPYINDRDKDVFSDAEKTIASNFTAEELFEIHGIALRLRELLDRSVDREQEMLDM